VQIDSVAENYTECQLHHRINIKLFHAIAEQQWFQDLKGLVLVYLTSLYSHRYALFNYFGCLNMQSLTLHVPFL